MNEDRTLSLDDQFAAARAELVVLENRLPAVTLAKHRKATPAAAAALVKLEADIAGARGRIAEVEAARCGLAEEALALAAEAREVARVGACQRMGEHLAAMGQAAADIDAWAAKGRALVRDYRLAADAAVLELGSALDGMLDGMSEEHKADLLGNVRSQIGESALGDVMAQLISGITRQLAGFQSLTGLQRYDPDASASFLAVNALSVIGSLITSRRHLMALAAQAALDEAAQAAEAIPSGDLA